jgi:hypothetical protein
VSALSVILVVGGTGGVSAADGVMPPTYEYEYEIEALDVTKLGGGAELSVALEGAVRFVRPAGAPRAGALEMIDLSGLRARAARSGGAVVGAADRGAPDPFPGLAQPVFVDRGGDGDPRRLAFAPSVERGTRQLIEYLVAELQILGARGHRTARWSRVERDTCGRYRAEYQRLGSRQLHKTKRAYDPEPGRPTVSVLASDRSVRLTAEGELEVLRANERLRIAEVGTETSSSFRATLVRSGVDERAIAPPTPALGMVWFELGSANAITSRERDDAALAGQTLEAVIDAVRTETGGKLFRAILRLSAFLRRDPARAVLAVSQQADADPSTLPRLVTALLDTGTAPADELVARWLTGASARGAAPETLAARAASNIILRHPPHPPLVDALWQIASDRGRPAWRRAVFALGAGAALLRAPDRAAASRLVARLLSDEAAASAVDRPPYLGALGATRDPDAFGRLAARLEVSDHATATAAAAALGFFDLPAATTLLDRTVSLASDPGVREAASRACGRRAAPARCHALAVVAVNDRDVNVRRAALDAVAAGGSPDAPPVVRRVRDHDADPELRKYAARKLAQLSGARPAPAIEWRATGE